jgi:hypothetical protein
VLLIGFFTDTIASFFSAPIFPQAEVPRSLERVAQSAEQELIKQVQEGTSLRKIAESLALSPNTILLMAEKMGILIGRRPKKVSALVRLKVRCALASGEPITRIMKVFRLSSSTINRVLGGDLALQRQRAKSLQESRRVRARTRLLMEIERAPNAGFKALRAALESDFAWLYRNDRHWLIDHIPAPVRVRDGNSPVDWLTRDSWMVAQVKLAVEEILTSSGRPVRVTLAEVGRRTGCASWLDKQRDKIPQTQEFLAQVLEPVTSFQLRRLAWWERQLDGQFVARWRVIRAAGLRRDGVAMASDDELNGSFLKDV